MSTDSYIDKQYAAAVPNYHQLVTENRYANYVSLTFTSASMWSNKSTPSGGLAVSSFLAQVNPI